MRGHVSFHALPLSHSPPQNLLYLLKRKTLPIPFQPVKPFEDRARTFKHRTPFGLVGNHDGFFVPKNINMESSGMKSRGE